MKFRFCGDQDCPDWFLTQIAVLSRLSSVKSKLVTQQVARQLMGQDLDMEKVHGLVADSKISEEDLQSLLSALHFILSSASRFATSEDFLRAELQQLGLPKETASAVAKVHQDSTAVVRQKLAEESLRTNRLDEVDCRLAADGSVELDLSVSSSDDSNASKRTLSLAVDPTKLQVLLFELERAHALMQRHGLSNEASET